MSEQLQQQLEQVEKHVRTIATITCDSASLSLDLARANIAESEWERAVSDLEFASDQAAAAAASLQTYMRNLQRFEEPSP